MSPLPAAGPGGKAFPVLVGWAGLIAAALVGGRIALNAGEALRFGAWELVRLDMALVLALLIPAAGLLPAIQGSWRDLVQKGRRPQVVLSATIVISGLAFALGRSPGAFLRSLPYAALLAAGFVILAAAVAALLSRRTTAAAAWMVGSAFLLSCAWQACVSPLIAYLFIR